MITPRLRALFVADKVPVGRTRSLSAGLSLAICCLVPSHSTSDLSAFSFSPRYRHHAYKCTMLCLLLNYWHPLTSDLITPILDDALYRTRSERCAVINRIKCFKIFRHAGGHSRENHTCDCVVGMGLFVLINRANGDRKCLEWKPAGAVADLERMPR